MPCLVDIHGRPVLFGKKWRSRWGGGIRSGRGGRVLVREGLGGEEEGETGQDIKKI